MTNPVYDDAAFFLNGNGANSGGGGGGGPVTVNTGPDREVLTMKDDSGPFLRHVVTNSLGVVSTNDTKLDGTTAHTVSGTVALVGGDGNGIPQTAADLVESISYSGTLGAGAYDRAAVLALVGGGATKLMSLSVTCAAGTIDFTQNGAVNNLAAGSMVDRPYATGFAVDDFTITVDASSQAYIQARGIA